MSNSTSTNADLSSVILGGPSDPKPIIRAENPSALTWPEGAAFAIVFERAHFPRVPWVGYHGEVSAIVVCFGADGWPLGLPEERKAKLSDVMKREFQVFPHDWWRFTPRDWANSEERPTDWARCRGQATLAHPVAAQTSLLVQPPR